MGTSGIAPRIDLSREVADTTLRKHHVVRAEVLD
jgi:hypothetical protein